MPRDAHLGFAERFGLWDAARAEAASELEARVREDDIQVVRVSFVDQHGTLRGKTLVASELTRALRNGVGCPSSLLLKDTSDRTVFPAYIYRWRRRRHGRNGGCGRCVDGS